MKSRLNQKPYFRDVWLLGPPDTGYPGAFPRGLIPAIKNKWWGQKRCWLFSGGWTDGGQTTVDIKPETNPSLVANCEKLPLDSNIFDFVMADPPYSEEESHKFYQTKYPKLVKVLNEMARITRPGGHALFLHRLYPAYHPDFSKDFQRLELVALVGVGTIAGFTNSRFLTVWRKGKRLEEGGLNEWNNP